MIRTSSWGSTQKPKKVDNLVVSSRAKRNRRAFSTMALAESNPPKKRCPRFDTSGQRRGGFRGRRGDPHTGGRLDAACGLTGANNSQPTNRELFALNQVLPTETEIIIVSFPGGIPKQLSSSEALYLERSRLWNVVALLALTVV